MIFWLGIAVAASSLFLSFALPQKTLRIRLLVLALGLIGLVLTAERYREDARTRQQIEKNISPRNLTSDQMSFIADKLKSLGSWTYDLSLPPMLEPGSSLDTEIISTLKNAGWKLESVQNDGPTTELSPLKAIYAINWPPRLPGQQEFFIPNVPHIRVGQNVGVLGVVIAWDKQGFAVSDVPVNEVWRALTDAGITTTTERRTNKDSKIIHIIIVSKP